MKSINQWLRNLRYQKQLIDLIFNTHNRKTGRTAPNCAEPAGLMLCYLGRGYEIGKTSRSYVMLSRSRLWNREDRELLGWFQSCEKIIGYSPEPAEAQFYCHVNNLRIPYFTNRVILRFHSSLIYGGCSLLPTPLMALCCPDCRPLRPARHHLCGYLWFVR